MGSSLGPQQCLSAAGKLGNAARSPRSAGRACSPVPGEGLLSHGFPTFLLLSSQKSLLPNAFLGTF